MASSQNKEEEKKKVKKLQKSYFDVLGICCTSEVPIIENILKSLDGVKDFSVIVPSRTVIVVHDSLLISPFQIAKALNQARLEANVRVNGETNFKNKWPSPFAVVSGLLLLLSFIKFVYSPLRWIAVAAVAAGIYPILAKAFASIKRLRIDINILVIITVIATLAMQDFMEAAAVVFLFTIADWLETRASYKASSVMQSLMSLAPQKAIIAETGEEVEVDEVKVSTVVAVKAGETIPIDGIVVDGNCEVDEKTLTGEAFPVPKQRDSMVWAGTINLNGYVTVKTTSLAGDCVVAKMAKLVEEAQSSKTKSQRLIDKCSQYYTPAIIIISAGFAIVPIIMKVHNLTHWFHLALVVLVSACPCGLILSTPVATFCALTKAATSGLLIKSADYLDTLSKIKIAAFDKTGTITRGEFIVIDFKSLSRDITLRSLLYWVSSVESKSSHPMAATIVDHAKSVSVEPKPEEVEDYQNFPGEGIYGKIDGNDIYIGNKRIASRAGCSTVPEIEVDTKGGKTVGYVYVGERLAGVFSLSDACRSGVSQAMTELKSMGIKTAMLTGDSQASAMHAQEQLGNVLDVVHGELLPEDKSKIIQEFKKEGPTAMVGDGVNDAPALATADIGISMGISGSALATQTGHIILMSNDIRRIPQAIKLARRARRKVVQNVFLSITFKAGILAFAFAGHPLIWAAVLVDVGTCLLVIFNSMLLLREKKKIGNKKCYRASTSMLNGRKLEGDDDVVDLEAGLLTKSGNGECNSGCCGDKKAQEKVMMRPSHTTSSDHFHSGCCGDKKQDNVKVVRDGCCGEKTRKPEGDIASLSSCKKSTTHVKHDLKMKGGSGCCANKNEKGKEVVAKSCCEKPKQEMESAGDCRSGRCEKKKQYEEIVPKEILGKELTVLEIELKTKDGETCKTSCCDKNEKVKETSLLLSSEDTSYLEKRVMIKDNVNCKSGFCDGENQTAEVTIVDCSSGCCENKATEKQTCHEKAALDMESGVSCDLKLVCCGKTEGEVGEQSDMEINIEAHCKSGCCIDEKQTGEINLGSEDDTANQDCSSACCVDKEEVTQSFHEKKHVVLVNEEGLDRESGVCCETKLVCCGSAEGEVEEKCDMELKNEGHCKSGCCSDEKHTGEITLASEEETESTDCSSGCCVDKEEVTSICHEKPVSLVVAGLETEGGGDCKSHCCGTGLTQEESSNLVNEESAQSGGCGTMKVSSQNCCSEREIEKVSSQSCCTSPIDLVLSDLQVKKVERWESSNRPIKVETCCKVKTPEACASICREREMRHSSKNCCRSYAKEFCGHGHHHHRHHHHHHHHHVSV
ncbi:PREDICTED: putative cadmium/zinc-transporting ATPase HMA4 isoform X1 [Camelina sativa]|uniref:Cadmium/zinc-transporting ATPase HMA4 isoform X1 n=2 Tax=Camelina sativa TaxID=90675 RepID=A0ABM1QD78_CAMSA|nr:PREDICTED: putative cadmium/zinc-transporting ATPase HMA4 isoform X1 [Camelina sativa]